MEKSARTQPLNLKHRCNSQAEIDAALAEGFDGVEIDLVWLEKDPCLSHEHGGRGEFLCLVDFRNCVVAVNVKEYGMYPHLKLPTARDWFAFDVPGAELDLYCMAGVRVFGRYSQWEDQCRMVVIPGTLVDDFTGTSEGQLKLYMSKTKPIAVISNELRGGVDSQFAVRNADYVIRKSLP